MTAGGPAAVASCEPISWLRLERYEIGELPAAERDAVAGHLAGCDRCRGCMDRIRADAARELPPLPATAPTPERRPTPPRWWRAFAFAGAGVTAAIAVALLVPRPPPVEVAHAGHRIGTKGGDDITWELVRERAGSIAFEPTSFAAGDRFKVLLTCPPPLHLHADLAVWQSGAPAFPGAPVEIACGNRVPLPLPFRITGTAPATVCVSVDPAAPPPRAEAPPGDPPRPSTSCAHLSGAPPE